MQISAEQVPLETIEEVRELYRREMNCQIVHDSWHGRKGWTESLVLRLDAEVPRLRSVRPYSDGLDPGGIPIGNAGLTNRSKRFDSFADEPGDLCRIHLRRCESFRANQHRVFLGARRDSAM